RAISLKRSGPKTDSGFPLLTRTHQARTRTMAKATIFWPPETVTHSVTQRGARVRASTGFQRESRQTDSNRRPADYKSAALPTELCRHFPRKIAVNLSSASAFLRDFSIRTALFSSRA